MTPEIQAKKRITYINTLQSAKELHSFIQYLDAKYGVDSTDPDNTFGRIFLYQPIIKHGVSNTLYFAGISTYNPEDLRLPKHKAIPHANSVIVINNKGQTSMAQSVAHIYANRTPITIEDKDIEKLVQLRQNFKKEVEEHAPAYPDFSSKEDHGFVDHDGKPISFDNLGPKAKAKIYDRLLKEQGYTNTEDHTFDVKLTVPNNENDDANSGIFEVKYYRLDRNRTPYFSTTFNGWQNQENINHSHPAYTFYKKWDVFHTTLMTVDEWTEMKADLDELIAFVDENN